MKRFIYAVKLFCLAFKKPELFQYDVMKTVESIFCFLTATAEAKRPMQANLSMKQIASITIEGKPELEEKVILHLWCGVGDTSTPIIRIRQLIEENEQLKTELRNKN